MFEPASLYIPPLTGLYPVLLPPHAVLAFSLPRIDAIAAFLTLRLMDQATRPCQKSTQAPRKASTAPTTMKTVPSGRLDFCMNGASAVFGTIMVGIPAPAMVGRLLMWMAPLPVDVPPVVANEEVAVLSAVLSAVVVASVELGALLVLVDSALEVSEVASSVVCVAVERSGRSVNWAVTIGTAKSARSASVCILLDMRAMAVVLVEALERRLATARLQQCYAATCS